jgi:hypothetical protein
MLGRFLGPKFDPSHIENRLRHVKDGGRNTPPSYYWSLLLIYFDVELVSISGALVRYEKDHLFR